MTLSLSQSLVMANCKFLVLSEEGPNLAKIDIDLLPGCDPDEVISIFKRLFDKTKAEICKKDDNHIKIQAIGLNNLVHVFKYGATLKAYLSIENDDPSPILIGENRSIAEVYDDLDKIKSIFGDTTDYSVCIINKKVYLSCANEYDVDLFLRNYSLSSGFSYILANVVRSHKLIEPTLKGAELCKN